MDKKRTVNKSIILIIFSILTISFIYPLFYMAINAIKTEKEYNMYPFRLPRVITLDNFTTMISQFKILQLCKNSFVISTLSILLILGLGIFASFSFAKVRFRGQKWIYMAVIVTMFIPGQVTMIPTYVLFAKVNLINNYWSVILSYVATFLPGAILLMTSNFRGISNELLESGKIDGCNYLQIVRNIVIPMGIPAIVIAIIFNFLTFWNDLFTPMILLQDMDSRTVMTALAALITRYNRNPTFQLAGLFISTLPALIVYTFFQKQIVKGMTMGSFR